MFSCSNFPAGKELWKLQNAFQRYITPRTRNSKDQEKILRAEGLWNHTSGWAGEGDLRMGRTTLWAEPHHLCGAAYLSRALGLIHFNCSTNHDSQTVTLCFPVSSSPHFCWHLTVLPFGFVAYSLKTPLSNTHTHTHIPSATTTGLLFHYYLISQSSQLWSHMRLPLCLFYW
jgi:hypothetical protein